MRTRPVLLDADLYTIGAYAGYLCKQAQAHPLMNAPTINLDFTTDRIPVAHTREVLLNDPYLNLDQKGQALAIVNNAGYNTQTGKTSVSGLAAGAMRVGFGLAGGAVAGHVLGAIFGLPKPVSRALSLVGGVFGALVNTGVVSGGPARPGDTLPRYVLQSN